MLAPLRLRALTLENFRAFRDPQGLELGADIVLLVGPNGYGKTSVVEALEVCFTERLVQRIGDPSDANLSPGNYLDLVNRHAADGSPGLCAQIRAELDVPGDADPHRCVNAAVNKDIKTDFRKLCAERGIDLDQDAERNVIRNSTFYYQDNLSSLMGLNATARRAILDYFVVTPPILLSIAGRAAALMARCDICYEELTSGDSPEKLDGVCQSHALAYERVAQRIGGTPPKLVKKTKGGGWQTRLSFGSIPADLGLTFPEERSDWAAGLAQCAARARERAKAVLCSAATAAENHQDLAAAARVWLGRLGTPIPTLAAVRLALEAIPATGCLAVEKQAAEHRLHGARGRLASLLSQDESHIAEASSRGHTTFRTGVIPFLGSLHSLLQEAPGQDGSDAQAFCSTVIQLVRDAGLTPAGVASAMTAAQSEYVECLQQSEDADRKLRSLGAAEAQRIALEEKEEALRGLQSALALRGPGAQLDDFASEGDPDHLDVDRLLREVGQGPAGDQPADEAALWDEFASACEEWATAEQRRDEAAKGVSSERDQRVREVQALGSVSGFLAKQPSGFSDRIRAALIRREDEEPLTAAVRAVLSRFTLHPEIRHNPSVKFDARQILRFTIGSSGDSGEERNALSTLSSGQLSAFAIALALVMNLGRESNPLGFVCLDGVSDTFDLNNLAADAAILRALAYAENADVRRQVILTTHHEELTARLVPLLRPPAGRSMHVIEFTDWSTRTGPTIRFYRCRPAQARSAAIRRLIPPEGVEDSSSVG